MYIDGPWAPTTYKDANFTGYGTRHFPEGPGGSVSVVGGEDLVIAKDAHAHGRHDQVRQVPPVAIRPDRDGEAGDMTAYKTDAANETAINPALKVFAKQLLTARARPVTQGYGALDTAFSNELQRCSPERSPWLRVCRPQPQRRTRRSSKDIGSEH